MKIKSFFFIISLMSLLFFSCGGGGSGGTDELQDVGNGWVSITEEYTDSYDTLLYGKAFVSPTAWKCCSGTAEDTGVKVVWENLTSGETGNTTQKSEYGCFFFSCGLTGHSWRAFIPLVGGPSQPNRILIKAWDPTGNKGYEYITVTPMIDNAAPVVSTTIPESNSLSNPVTIAITGNFNEKIEPSSVTASSFYVQDDTGNLVPGSLTVSGNNALFTPDDSLDYQANYFVTLTTDIIDIAGNSLAENYTWQFSTGTEPDTYPPSVISTVPSGGNMCNPVDTLISATFNEPLDPYSINQNNIHTVSSDGTWVSGFFSYSDNTATITPVGDLTFSTDYTVTISSTIKDLAGNSMGNDYVWEFTTSAANGFWQEMATEPSHRNSIGNYVSTVRTDHASVWTGSEMIVWGGRNEYYQSLNTGGRYDPVADKWVATNLTGAPDASLDRSYVPYAVWDGSEMFVAGKAYNPSADSWRDVSCSPNASSVWTGSEIVSWGSRYDPVTDTVQPTSTINAPSSRFYYSTIWTGAELIIWGGFTGQDELGDGARYNPSTDTWAPVSMIDAPSPRFFHSAAWTGSEMIIWGGRDSTAMGVNSGASYNPVTDSWKPMSTDCAPRGRYQHSTAWTGGKMIVWGGQSCHSAVCDVEYFNTGGIYDPTSDSWSAMTTIGVPADLRAAYNKGIWAGDRMIVYGGWTQTYSEYRGLGGVFLP